MRKISAFLLMAAMLFTLAACGADKQDGPENLDTIQEENMDSQSTKTGADNNDKASGSETAAPPEDFVLITGGTFEMGSPDTESWRSDDELQHTVAVSDFYMGIYELTQEEYSEVMGSNPNSFSGNRLPVESVTWLDAVSYCNARSEKEGLRPAYTVEGQAVTWDRSADGYRLSTEAEWEYACRAKTETPFHTENSIRRRRSELLRALSV